MSRAGRAIFRLLGVVELIVDGVDLVRGLFKKKKPTVGDLLKKRAAPIPLVRKREKQG